MTMIADEYRTEFRRAQRRFALCVIQIQSTHNALVYRAMETEWRAKANRLQYTIVTAQGMAANGFYVRATELLQKENEPT